MYLFIYKTTHINGKYYIGRHETTDLNDGYLGSGDWVKGVKDKSTLTREIIAEATSFEELKSLEEYHINLHFGKPGCMNIKRGSDGWTSTDMVEINRKRIADGTHIFLDKEFQKEKARKLIEAGTHPVFDLHKEWTCGHCGLQSRGNGQYKQHIKSKKCLDFFKPKETAKDRVNMGTHNFLGSELQKKRMANGTHPSQLQWTCEICGKSGKGKGIFTRFHGSNCKSLTQK